MSDEAAARPEASTAGDEPAPSEAATANDDGTAPAAFVPATAAEPSVDAPAPVPPHENLNFIKSWRQSLHEYFFAEDPNFATAIVPMSFLSMLLFTRHPTKTNFIFDEQEALLANPYVRSVADPKSSLRWVDAFFRDFWGLPPDRSIGSYRPIPDLVWRALWGLGARDQSPFLHHWVNVLLHGVNGAIMVLVAHKITKDKTTAWLTGVAFTACAVLTEAVSGVVGIADVLGGLGVILAMAMLSFRLPWMALGVFLSTLFGLYSKESALCAVPLVPFLAFACAEKFHPEKPRRFLRGLVALLVAGAAFVLYVETRRRWFPAPLPPELSIAANEGKPWKERAFHGALRWYAQPILPRDPLNNPLALADGPHRIAGAFRVYARSLWQLFCPWTLSGDYSAPQEPIPTSLYSVETILGAAAFILPFPLALYLVGRSLWKKVPGDLRGLIAVAIVWIPISYFPVSNIPAVLPTVRAERFLYFPAIGSSFLFAVVLTILLREGKRRELLSLRRGHAYAMAAVTAFFVFQGFSARRHANHYTNDLVFWDATRRAVPRSAKAHLNYSVMKGARGDLNARLASNATALELAPQWPMASIYYGDTLCRLHRPKEAFAHYEKGFHLAPNDVNLIALALQCLWDEKMFEAEGGLRDQIGALPTAAEKGSWLDYLVVDTLNNGATHNGVDPKHRPRGYNEGPKE